MFPVLIVKGLTFGYEPGVPFIKGADLSVEPGAIQAVVGLSGSGKTTLAQLVSGRLEPSSGTIHIQGKLTSFRDLRDNPALGIRVIDSIKCAESRDTVADALQIEGVPTRFGIKDVRELNKRALSLLTQVGMPNMDPAAPICELTAGKRKLIEVASLVSKSTSLLILDDPTACMTEAEALQLYRQLSTIAYAGAGILYFTSRAVEALQVGDCISVLREGALPSNHSPEQVFAAQIVGEMLGREVPISCLPVELDPAAPRLYCALKDLASVAASTG
jgi:ribose transport system ATP-binding protein